MAAPSKLSRRTRFRSFSLRTGLFLFLLLGVSFGLLGRWVQNVRESGEAQLELQELSSSANWRKRGPADPMVYISYEDETETYWFTKFVRKRIHPEYQRRIARASISGFADRPDLAQSLERSFGCELIDVSSCQRMSPQFASSLFRTKHLKTLYLHERFMQLTDIEPALSELENANALEFIELRSAFVSESIAAKLAAAPKLRELIIDSCPPEAIVAFASARRLEKLTIGSLRHSASDFRQGSEEDFGKRSHLAIQQALKILANRPSFTFLKMDGALHLRPEDLSEFCRQSRLKHLHLHRPALSPDCLAELANLKNLEALHLYDLAITDEHVPVLANAKNLKELTIGPNVSIPAVKSLREKLPKCSIQRY